jgi:hypothetical protein
VLARERFIENGFGVGVVDVEGVLCDGGRWIAIVMMSSWSSRGR